MNDISLKIVESPKSHGGVDVSPSGDTVADNEVDPLALDEAEVDRVKEPVSLDAVLEKANDEKAGNCDDNAKEKVLSESQNGSSDSFVNVQSENAKGNAVLCLDVHTICLQQYSFHILNIIDGFNCLQRHFTSGYKS